MVAKRPIEAGHVNLLPRFTPWIGEHYQQILDAVEAGETAPAGFHQRVLILGEAHYARPDDPEAYVDTPTLTLDTLNDWAFSTDRHSAFFTRVTNLAASALGREANADIWLHFAFAEYVQTLVVGGPRTAPTREQWDDGKRRFFGLLAKIRPCLIIVLGGRLWRELPCGIGAATPPMQLFKDTLVDEAWIYPYWVGDDLETTLAVKITHPSAGFGNWKPELMEREVRTAKYYYSNMLEYFYETYEGIGKKPFWSEPTAFDMSNAESTFIQSL